jgi:hypothetical protein
MNQVRISAVRCEALFVSQLQRSDNPSVGQIRDAIVQARRRFGIRGCAERMAQEFGDHPETAVRRMRWVRHMIDHAFDPAQPLSAQPRVPPGVRLREPGKPAAFQLNEAVRVGREDDGVPEPGVPEPGVPKPAGRLPVGVR